MNGTKLLLWHNLIFLLPVAVASLLLLLSALHSLAGEGESEEGGEESDGGDESPSEETDGEESGEGESEEPAGRGWTGVLAAATGFDRAPLSLLSSVFALTWGIAGFFANQRFIGDGPVGFLQVLPSLGVATVAALVCTRVIAEGVARLLPKKESAVVSREELFGLSGRVLFAVSETTGRIRVYDEHGTLHESECRTMPGQAGIEKGRRARIIDKDATGRLIVEETQQ